MFVLNNIGPEDLTDEKIAEFVQQGDSDKFGLLIDRYQEKILRYAKKFLFKAENAEDLVQDVFIKAYTNIENFDVNLNFSSWLYRIAHNHFINAIGKKSRVLWFFDMDLIFPRICSKDRTDKDILDKELKTILDKSIAGLGVKYREAIVLYYFEELSYKQISEILHIPVSAVGIRINRAKKMLKKIIKI